MKKLNKAVRPSNTRWFLIMNVSIALLLVCAAVVLKKGTSSFDSQAKFDRGYIAQAKAETNTDTLKHGIIHTEAARATAYRSVMDVSNGASITWLIVAAAFIMNAIFIFRMNRKHQLIIADAAAA